MGFINVALDDAKEAEAVPDGEYDLRIVKAEDRDSKKGNPITMVTLRVEDPNYPNAALINHCLNYPNKNQTPENNALFLRNIARFLALFEVPREANGFNSEDLPGLTATCLLEQETSEFGVQNRLVLPRMKE